MATISVYKQFFEAEGCFNGRDRHGAQVMLISDSDAGQFRYEASISFIPHDDKEDFAVSYDAYFTEVMFEGKGRRSKKREIQLLEKLGDHIEKLADRSGGKVFLNKPLTKPSYDKLIQNEINFVFSLDKQKSV